MKQINPRTRGPVTQTNIQSIMTSFSEHKWKGAWIIEQLMAWLTNLRAGPLLLSSLTVSRPGRLKVTVSRRWGWEPAIKQLAGQAPTRRFVAYQAAVEWGKEKMSVKGRRKRGQLTYDLCDSRSWAPTKAPSKEQMGIFTFLAMTVWWTCPSRAR